MASKLGGESRNKEGGETQRIRAQILSGYSFCWASFFEIKGRHRHALRLQ